MNYKDFNKIFSESEAIQKLSGINLALRYVSNNNWDQAHNIIQEINSTTYQGLQIPLDKELKDGPLYGSAGPSIDGSNNKNVPKSPVLETFDKNLKRSVDALEAKLVVLTKDVQGMRRSVVKKAVKVHSLADELE